jgi:hypothetical protein
MRLLLQWLGTDILNRGVGLPSYRLYQLDGAGNIISADWLEADADDDALRQAHEQAGGARFELWDRDRLITSSRASGQMGG